VRKQALFFIIVSLGIALTAFTGCGGVSVSGSPQSTPSPTPGASPSPTPAAAASRFIYGITVFESDTGYEGGTINSAGKVTPLAPFDNSGLGQNIVPQLIAHPSGRFLYSLNLGASSFGMMFGTPGIAELAINQQTGSLTPIAGGPLVFPVSRDGILAINPAGTLLFQPDAGVFDVYSINPSSGLLSLVSTSTAASQGNFTAFSPDGRFLFNAGPTDVETLSVDAGGNLTIVQAPIPTGGLAPGLAGQLAVSPDGKLLYALNQGSIGIFNVGAGGTLSPVAGSPFATPDGGAGFALTPDGKRLYVNFQNTANSVQGFTFDPAASTLTPIANAVVNNASSVTVDGSGKFAYISQGSVLTTFAIDPASGGLTQVSQSPEPLSDTPQSIVAVP
jgi:6-phosphogluconolactonase (cycloisomerase 2 family)